ncbi:type II toxin-antitoxin system ParD family antitoxin [Arenibacterium sp. LLYu02]|uniref:type II toxin-antitoxin system ParD family antitoxin n=1 Tax=Arenibacterium sp. LLYu02 TaxID=3404132 RepID=UPI003B20FFAB
MSVKASISLTEAQEAFARGLVSTGRYSSLSAVLQQGLELLRHQTEADSAETEALRLLLAERRAGPKVDATAARASTTDMLARKREALGL